MVRRVCIFLVLLGRVVGGLGVGFEVRNMVGEFGALKAWFVWAWVRRGGEL